MEKSLTLNGTTWPRILSFFSGIGMMVASILTIRHFFLANYPSSIFEGAFCDISAFFNCDSSAFSRISQVGGVPLGYFGLFVGALFALGALFPSERFERTNKFISVITFLGVIGLLLYSVFSWEACVFYAQVFMCLPLLVFFFSEITESIGNNPVSLPNS